MFQSREFNPAEMRTVIDHMLRLYKRGHFTGANLIQNDAALPLTGILVHFLHSQIPHLENIQKAADMEGKILSRQTFYRTDPKYHTKDEFWNDYANATFFDDDLTIIPLEDAWKMKKVLNVKNPEFDLLLDLTQGNLEAVINRMQVRNDSLKTKWEDPVVIVKSPVKLASMPGFINELHFVSLTRGSEEFYVIVNDESRLKSLQSYLKKLCATPNCPSTLSENAFAFHPSQVNKEFATYMLNRSMPFQPEE